MVLVDSAYYHNVFGGTMHLTNADFLKAQAYVDRITFGRISDGDVDENVKNAVCAVAEVYGSSDSHLGIQMEDNDGYRIQYRAESNTQTAIRKQCAAALFLPAELLYRGMDTC